MKKLKWKYIKTRKVWKPIGYRGLQIMEGLGGNGYVVQWVWKGKFAGCQPIATFSTLNKAKLVAQLIYEG